jgi:predicted XRE-type DNA-binding protein
MSSIGKGVWELKEGDERTWYRMMYLARIGNVIHVLHCFERTAARPTEETRNWREHGFKSCCEDCVMRKRNEPSAHGLRSVPIMNKPTHITKGDVLDDLGFSRSEASALKVKAAIVEAILAEIDRRGFTQRELVDVLDEYQPNVSNLLRGRIGSVSIEKLLHYADRLKMQSRVELRPPAGTSARKSKTAAARRAVYA